MHLGPGSPWAWGGVAAVCSGVAGRKSFPFCGTHISVTFLSSSFSSPLDLFFSEVSFHCRQWDITQWQEVWHSLAISQAKIRAYCFPKCLSAARRSSVCSIRRSFLFTSFLPLSSSPLGLSIKHYGSSICSGVPWICRTVTTETWACDSWATSVRTILVGEIQHA